VVQLAETGLEAGPARTPPQPAPPYARLRSQGQSRALTFSASLADAFEERRFFILLPFAAIAGLCVCAALPMDPALPLLPAGFGLLVAVLVVGRHSLSVTRFALLFLAAWAGFSLLPLHGALLGTAMLARPAYGTYQARVDAILSETAAEARVVLSEITPVDTARPLPIRRARVIVANGPDLAPGDLVSGPFRFAPVPGAVVPGGFDTQFHAYFDGLGAYGNSTRPPEIISPGSETAPGHIIDSIRRGIANRIDAVLPQPAAGIARAIINGDQSTIPDAARDTMATAGIAHVLSVSGLHLTIVAGGVFAALRMLLAASATISRRVPVKRVAAFGGILAAAGYFAISGGNVAAFRSTLMIVLVFGAVLFGRRALTMRNVALAALVVIATDPASVFRPSFQLSFAAVAALVGAYESLRRDGERDAGWLANIWGYFAGITVTSLVAGAATLLFSVYHFQQTSPLGVLGNLATLPLVGFIMMPAALIAVLDKPQGI
jgi:competence protein ComEC